MSTTRKPKPPDKGAPPEHKPSRKVALEEVMRSLQDLVNNELATEPAKQSGEPAADTAKKSRATGKQAAAPSASPPETATASAESIPEIETITQESLPEVAATAPSAPEPRAAPNQVIPAGGLQQELPYLEPLSSAPSESQPSAAAAHDNPAAGATTVTDNNAPPDASAPPLAKAAPAPPEELNWDDIPVLDEAVELLEETEVGATGHAVGGPATTNLPPADAARRLSIQVAARLNVELRKSGQPGLSSDIITRLARLLQEALAKGTSNMENSPPDKH